MKLLKTIWNLLVYLVDWSCPYKRNYWTEWLTSDFPILGFDFSIFLAWFYFPEIIQIVGKSTGAVAGILGCYLTYLKIVQTRKQIKALDQNKPPEQ